MRRWLESRVQRGISLLITFLGFLVTFNEAFRYLLTVYVHRLIVAVRETSGRTPFEPLSRCPRHVNLVIGQSSGLVDVERAIRTIIEAGVERVTVSHDGSLSLSDESYVETVSRSMGRERLVLALKERCIMDEGSLPDAVLLLNRSSCWMMSSVSTLQLPASADGSLLYYSELLPLYSLNPSDVFLAVSLFQSKTQRFGR